MGVTPGESATSSLTDHRRLAAVPGREAPRQDASGGIWRGLLDRVTTSQLNYRASYFCDLCVPLLLFVLGWRTDLAPLPTAFSLGAGLFAFSFIEYAIHRWLFHSPTCFMRVHHDAHHHAPIEATALPCITSAVVAVASWLVMDPLLGTGVTAFFLCGVMLGYFWYAVLHHLEHHIGINRLPWRWLRRRWAMHSVHHKLPHTNFGVTTSLWDRLFGTHYQSKSGRRPME
jgi:sterol desaturase/sphingolipid hydroxylase (fatty acid hydroxylase superfamily)